MDYQSCTKIRRKFTDRGLGYGLVLSATTSSGEIAEEIETHIIHAGAYLLVKDEMFIMCDHVHFEDANV